MSLPQRKTAWAAAALRSMLDRVEDGSHVHSIGLGTTDRDGTEVHYLVDCGNPSHVQVFVVTDPHAVAALNDLYLQSGVEVGVIPDDPSELPP